jgi:hypothetical protein
MCFYVSDIYPHLLNYSLPIYASDSTTVPYRGINISRKLSNLSLKYFSFQEGLHFVIWNEKIVEFDAFKEIDKLQWLPVMSHSIWGDYDELAVDVLSCVRLSEMVLGNYNSS